MRISSSLGGLMLGVALSLITASALADDEEENVYPLPYAARPMTLAKQSLSPEVTLDATRLVKENTSSILRELQTNLSLEAGAAYGISKSLEVEAALATLQILPKVAYGNPRVGATFRFLATALEMGVRAEAVIVTDPLKTGAQIEASAPMLLHLGESFRLDFGAGLPITIQKEKTTVIGLDVPLALAINPVDTLHIGVRTSAFITDFKHAPTTLTVPLGVFAGFCFGTESPFFEIAPFFTWPKFAQPGVNDPGTKKINIDVFTAGLTLRGFIYL